MGPRERRELISILGGGAAALAAALVMTLARSLDQVRTVPERLLEWLLLFVPLDIFEGGIQRFGFEAKRYALFATILVVLLALGALGAYALRRGEPPVRLVGLGGVLWLATMVVLMPLTGAGFFATGLLGGTWATLLAYLAAGLAYGGTLAAARGFLDEPDPLTLPATDLGALLTRRSAVGALGGSFAALAIATFAARRGPQYGMTRVVVLDPQEPLPSGGIDPPAPHPPGATTTPAGTAQAVTGPTEPAQPAAAAAQPTPSAADAPNVVPPPVRPTASPTVVRAARALARDKDGAVLAAARKPGELAELITPPGAHYVVSKNPVADPELRAEDWRLVVDGEVSRSIQLDLKSLRNLPAVEVTKTLECISNFVTKCELAPFGCDLMSTARWRGARLSDVIGLAGGLRPGVVALAAIGADEYTTALPIDVAMAPDTLLVYEMNGEPVPIEHGFPVRVLVPGRYGLKNAKWVVALRPMRREFVDWYGQRSWSKTGIVRTMTRIDTPAPGAALTPGDQRIAGVAYAGDRGIAKVEYSADGGKSWQVAELVEKPVGTDSWVRWFGKFTIHPGAQLTLVSRATDGSGALQEEPFSLPQPDGGAGWHSVEVHSA